MNSLKYINTLLRSETILLLIMKESEPDFWGHTTIGRIAYSLNKKKDCLLITEKEIFYMIRSKLKNKIQYKGFENIHFNHMNDRLYYIDINDNEQSLHLLDLRITYEEIQYLKSKLNES